MDNWSSTPNQSLPAAENLETPEVRFSTLNAVAVLIFAFCIYVVGSIIVAVINAIVDRHHIGFWVIPVSYLSLTLGTFIGVGWLVSKRRATWSSIGFRLPPQKSWMAGIGRIALVAIIAYIFTTVGVAIIVGLFNLTPFHIKSNVKELLPSGQSSIDLAQYVTLVVVAAILAPLTEETLFRGILYQGMRRDLSKVFARPAGIGVAAITSGVIFGGFHLIGGSSELYTLPVLAYLGIVLAFAFQASRSLGGSMLVHAGVNFSSITYLFVHSH